MPQAKKYDVLGIGSPLLDLTVKIDDGQLADLKFNKGSMNLISKEQSNVIRAFLKENAHEISPGGSSANTLSGVNVLGNRAAFLGVIGQDDFGQAYRDHTIAEGVSSHLITNDSQATGHSYILITPDGERTMATHLGAATSFNKNHVNEELIADTKILHIEAYQLEQPKSHEALMHAVASAKKHSVLVSLDLSDAGLIRRNKELFKQVVHDHIDIVFANEAEAMAFTDVAEADAVVELSRHCQVAVVKLGERGSLIRANNHTYEISAHEVEPINTNGAGDMYAAGILHSIINQLGWAEAGKVASHIAGLVVASSGARLDKKHHQTISKYKSVK
ncbi:MAG: adenosine kinase [Candidatus Falkowbacteria bacterium]